MKKHLGIVVLGLFFFGTANSNDKIDKWKWDFNSLTSEKKIFYCIPLYELLKDNAAYNLSHFYKQNLSKEQKLEYEKKYVRGYYSMYLPETVSMVYMVKQTLNKSIEGSLTSDMKIDLLKKNELTNKSGAYLDGLSFIEVSDSKIAIECMINYMNFSNQNNEFKNLVSKFSSDENIYSMMLEEFDEKLYNLINE